MKKRGLLKNKEQKIKGTLGGTNVKTLFRLLSSIKNANRIVVVNEEGIAEQGNHEELMALNGAYKKLYDAQFAS